MASGRVDGDGQAADYSVLVVTEENYVDDSGRSLGVVEEAVEVPEFGGSLPAVAGSGLLGGWYAVLHEVLHFLGAGELEGGVGHQSHVHGPGVDDDVLGDHSRGDGHSGADRGSAGRGRSASVAWLGQAVGRAAVATD